MGAGELALIGRRADSRDRGLASAGRGPRVVGIEPSRARVQARAGRRVHHQQRAVHRPARTRLLLAGARGMDREIHGRCGGRGVHAVWFAVAGRGADPMTIEDAGRSIHARWLALWPTYFSPTSDALPAIFNNEIGQPAVETGFVRLTAGETSPRQ